MGCGTSHEPLVGLTNDPPDSGRAGPDATATTGAADVATLAPSRLTAVADAAASGFAACVAAADTFLDVDPTGDGDDDSDDGEPLFRAPESFEDGLKCLQAVKGRLKAKAPSRKLQRTLAMFESSKSLLQFVVVMAIPPPGGHIVSAAIEIAHAAVQAVFNSKNSCLLAGRMADVVHAICQHLAELSSAERLTDTLEKIREIQTRVLDYVTEFSNKGFLKRALNYGDDVSRFKELDALVTTVLSGLSTNLKLQTFSTLVQLTDRLAKDKLALEDRDAALRADVASLGDADALADPENEEKLRQIILRLSPGEGLLASMVQQGFKLAAADREEGTHSYIHHPELQLLWRKKNKYLESTPWEAFWSIFPAHLPTLPDTLKKVLRELFEDATCKAAFELEVDSDNVVERLSVRELAKAFPGSIGHYEFIERVHELVCMGRANNPGSILLQPSISGKPVASKLLQVHRGVFGRDHARDHLADALQSGKSHLACVVGAPGMGTTVFANAVAQQLFMEGYMPGGAFYVNLEEATTKEMAMNKIVEKINGRSDGRGENSFLPCMEALRSRNQPCLIILDHCDGVLLSGTGLQSLLRQMMLELVHKLVVILCARQKVDLDVDVDRPDDVELAALGLGPAVDLLCSMAPRLTREQAKAVAGKCGGHPTALTVMGRRLKSAGAAELAEAARPLVDAQDQPNANAVAINSALAALGTIWRPRAVLVALFPGTFSDQQAKQLLSLHSVNEARDLMRAMVDGCLATPEGEPSSTALFCLQPAVRQLFRDMLAAGSVPREQVLQARRAMVLLTLAYVSEQTSWYRHSPKTSYDCLLAFSPLVIEVLRLPDTDKEAALLSLTECVALLRLLHYVDVYDAAMVRAACAAWRALCEPGAGGDPWPAAACVAVGAFYRDGNDQAARTAALEQIAVAVASLPLAPWTPLQCLVLGVLERAKGLALRDAKRLDQSIAAFKAALQVAAAAFDAPGTTGQFDRILNNAELAGTLDYLGMTTESPEEKAAAADEGSLYAEAAVQAAALFLPGGEGAHHPLMALCLTRQAYILKMRGEYVPCVVTSERALTITIEVFGAEHMEVAICWQLKAQPLLALGLFKEGNECNESSLRIRLKLCGPDHLMVANTRLAIGNALRLQGPERAADAEAAYWQALRIRRKRLDAGHPDIGKVQVALGALLRDLGRVAEAGEVESGMMVEPRLA